MVAGISAIPAIKVVAPRTYAEGWFDRNTDYGRRMKMSWTNIVQELENDIWSRRAQVYIGNNEDAVDDKPCTTTIQVLARDPKNGINQKKLFLIAHMRSLDLLRGLPVDVAIWNVLISAISHMISVPIGGITISTTSAHIYTRDMWMMEKNMGRNAFCLSSMEHISN